MKNKSTGIMMTSGTMIPEWLQDEVTEEEEYLKAATSGRKVCRYCRNSSGKTDSRGRCISCGADLNKEETKK